MKLIVNAGGDFVKVISDTTDNVKAKAQDKEGTPGSSSSDPIDNAKAKTRDKEDIPPDQQSEDGDY